MAKRKKTLWDKADEFAAKNAAHAIRMHERGLHGVIHEYLRFAFMRGYGRKRDEDRKSRSE